MYFEHDSLDAEIDKIDEFGFESKNNLAEIKRKQLLGTISKVQLQSVLTFNRFSKKGTQSLFSNSHESKVIVILMFYKNLKKGANNVTKKEALKTYKSKL